MGAEFNTVSIPVEKITKTQTLKDIYREIVDECRYMSGHGGYTGTFAEAPELAISSKKFDSLDAAYKYLEDAHEKWEPAIAVLAKTEDGKERWVIGAWCSS